jgi:type I restriction enzyme, S subunit
LKSNKLEFLTSKIGSGVTPRGGKSVYQDSGINLVRSQNIYNDKFERKGLVCISDEIADKMKSVELLKNDILINITGDSVARVHIIPDEILPARVNQHVCILRTKSELNPFYLYYFLISENSQNHLLSIAGGGGTRNSLTKETLLNLIITYPDIQVQKNIVNHLNCIKNNVKILENQNKILEEIVQTIFKSWFVDFDGVCNFKDSELGEIPKGYEIGKIKDVIQIFDDERIPLSSMIRIKKQGNVPYYGATSIIDFIDDYIFEGKFLLLGEDGSVIHEDGTPFVQYVDGRIWVNNHAHVIQGKGKISTEFLFLFFKKLNINPWITGTTQLKINQTNLLSIPIIIPDDNIIKKFEQIISPIFTNILKNEKTIQKLKKLQEVLLPKLMSGINGG